MSERLNLIVEDGISDLLTELAGGERKRGQYVTNLVKAIHEQRQTVDASDLEQIRMGFAGLVGTVKVIDGRLLQVERTIAAMMAQGAEQAEYPRGNSAAAQ